MRGRIRYSERGLGSFRRKKNKFRRKNYEAHHQPKEKRRQIKDGENEKEFEKDGENEEKKKTS